MVSHSLFQFCADILCFPKLISAHKIEQSMGKPEQERTVKMKEKRIHSMNSGRENAAVPGSHSTPIIHELSDEKRELSFKLIWTSDRKTVKRDQRFVFQSVPGSSRWRVPDNSFSQRCTEGASGVSLFFFTSVKVRLYIYAYILRP